MMGKFDITFITDVMVFNFKSIYEKSSSGIINIRPKKWD